MLAVTTQVVGLVVLSTAPVILQPSLSVANVTAPAPEPPVVVSVIAVPAIPLLLALLITRVAWLAIVNSKLAAADVFAP